MDAIVYTTNAGSTRRYAQLLAKEAGLPVYSLEEAKKRVPAGAEVIYLGWIMAGAVKGYGCAARRYRVRAVCGVGMGRTGSQEDAVREKTGVPAEVPVFTLQGDFDVKKLRGGLPADDGDHGQNRGQGPGRKAGPDPGGGRDAGRHAPRRAAGPGRQFEGRTGLVRRGAIEGRDGDAVSQMR